MNHNTYMQVTTVVFVLVALLHVARFLFGWEAVIGGWIVPTWLSFVFFLGASFLAYSGYRFQR